MMIFFGIGTGAVLIAVLITSIYFIQKQKSEERLIMQQMQEKLEQYGDLSGRGIELVGKIAGVDYAEHEVLCEAASEEIAQQVAKKCDGKVKSFSEGIAVISIDETVEELFSHLENSVEDTLPIVYPNYIRTTQSIEISSGDMPETKEYLK